MPGYFPLFFGTARSRDKLIPTWHHLAARCPVKTVDRDRNLRSDPDSVSGRRLTCFFLLFFSDRAFDGRERQTSELRDYFEVREEKGEKVKSVLSWRVFLASDYQGTLKHVTSHSPSFPARTIIFSLFTRPSVNKNKIAIITKDSRCCDIFFCVLFLSSIGNKMAIY